MFSGQRSSSSARGRTFAGVIGMLYDVPGSCPSFQQTESQTNIYKSDGWRNHQVMHDHTHGRRNLLFLQDRDHGWCSPVISSRIISQQIEIKLVVNLATNGLICWELRPREIGKFLKHHRLKLIEDFMQEQNLPMYDFISPIHRLDVGLIQFRDVLLSLMETTTINFETPWSCKTCNNVSYIIQLAANICMPPDIYLLGVHEYDVFFLFEMTNKKLFPNSNTWYVFFNWYVNVLVS